MIKTILFDLGGVIYQHPRSVIPVILQKIYRADEKLAKNTYDKYKERLITGKIIQEELLKNLAADFKKNIPQEEILKKWVECYRDLTKPNKEILQIIQNLHRNYNVYLFSNTSLMSNLHNSQSGIYDYFDDVFLSYRIGIKKPDLIIYQYVLRTINEKPENCLFIDDQEANIQTAKEMGINTILFNILTEKPEELIKKLTSQQIKI